MAKSKSSKSSKSSTTKVKGPFETYNLFEKMDLSDHCWEDGDSKVSGPGTLCWIYIYYIILVNIISLFAIKELQLLGFTNGQIFIRYFFQFLYMFLSATFMYSMCKRCRGLEGFLILLLLGFVATIIAVGPFLNKIKGDIQTLKKNNIVEGNFTCTR